MSDWIGWNGGECPAGFRTIVEVMLADGSVVVDAAGQFEWGASPQHTAIVAYRIVPVKTPVGLARLPEGTNATGGAGGTSTDPGGKPKQLRGDAVKLSNPKDVVGVKKLAFSCLPWQVLCRVGLGMMEGAGKYGRHNYRAVGVRASVYFDAVVGRHLTAWWEGEDIDAESGLHHIDKAIAGLMVLRDAMLQDKFEDDRPPRAKAVDFKELNALAAKIIEQHADKNPKHYTIKDEV